MDRKSFFSIKSTKELITLLVGYGYAPLGNYNVYCPSCFNGGTLTCSPQCRRASEPNLPANTSVVASKTPPDNLNIDLDQTQPILKLQSSTVAKRGDLRLARKFQIITKHIFSI